jgi:hypothetical protein
MAFSIGQIITTTKDLLVFKDNTRLKLLAGAKLEFKGDPRRPYGLHTFTVISGTLVSATTRRPADNENVRVLLSSVIDAMS